MSAIGSFSILYTPSRELPSPTRLCKAVSKAYD